MTGREQWAYLTAEGDLRGMSYRAEARDLRALGAVARVRILYKIGAYVPARRQPDLHRIQRLNRAMFGLKNSAMISLIDMAALWGTSKGNFVNELRRMETYFGMPEPKVVRQRHFYPARHAITVMLAYERRDERLDRRPA